MTAFIPYQPRRSVSAFQPNSIYASTSVGLPDSELSRRSRRLAEWPRSSESADPECSLTRETPEARERGSIEHRPQGDTSNGGSSVDDSDDSELPTLAELLSRAGGKESSPSLDLGLRSATSEQPDHNNSRTDRSGAGAEAAVDVIPGSNQDNPIVLDEPNVEQDNGHGAAASGRDNSILSTVSPADRPDPSMTEPPSKSVVNDAHGAQSSEPKHTLQEREDEEDSKEERYRSKHHTKHTNEGSACDGVGQERLAPASAGHIHDIFAEYERRFSMNGAKQRSQLRTPHAHSTHNSSDYSGLPDTRQSVRDNEHHTDATSDDPHPTCILGAGPTQPTSELRQDGKRPITSTKDAGLDRSTSTSDFQEPDNAPSPSPSHIATNTAAGSGARPAPRNVSTRKRPSQSPESVNSSPVDPASKRPRRIAKESWKAKEARELSEAKQILASSDSQPRSRRCPQRRVTPARFLGDGHVEDVEDVYLGEDGSIQCVVRWKASLVTKEHLVSEALRRRCEELFKKKYGAQEWRNRLGRKLVAET